MTLAGWIFMVVSIGAVVALVSYCYYRVLTTSINRDDSED